MNRSSIHELMSDAIESMRGKPIVEGVIAYDEAGGRIEVETGSINDAKDISLSMLKKHGDRCWGIVGVFPASFIKKEIITVAEAAKRGLDTKHLTAIFGENGIQGYKIQEIANIVIVESVCRNTPPIGWIFSHNKDGTIGGRVGHSVDPLGIAVVMGAQ